MTNTIQDEVTRLMGVGDDPDTATEEEILPEEKQELEVEGEGDTEELEDGEGAAEEGSEDGEESGDAEDKEESEDKEGEEPESDMDKLTRENEELKVLLEEVLKPKVEEVEGGEEKPATTQLEVKTQSYITAEEMDSIVGVDGSAEALNKVLNTVRQDAINTVVEHVAKSIPNLVASEVYRTVSTQNTINEFYIANPDLRKFKQFSGYIYNGLSDKFQGKKMMDFLEGSKLAVEGGYDLATEVKKQLKIRGGNATVPKEESKPKPMPGGSSGSARRGVRDKPVKPKGVKSEVEALKKKFGVR